VAIFIFWGWDTAVTCNEESDDPGRTPGRAAVISTVLLLVLFMLVSVAAVAFAAPSTSSRAGSPTTRVTTSRFSGTALLRSSASARLGWASS
jgi:amino acid transporter